MASTTHKALDRFDDCVRELMRHAKSDKKKTAKKRAPPKKRIKTKTVVVERKVYVPARKRTAKRTVKKAPKRTTKKAAKKTTKKRARKRNGS